MILRHAKSVWPAGVPDNLRPLNARGERDAIAAGEWLASARLHPDLILVSPAMRTMQTWQGVAEALGVDPDAAETVPGLYHASPAAILRAIGDHAGPEDRVVLVIAHNPGCEELALLLDDDKRSEAAQNLRFKYPTAGIAVLDSAEDWRSWLPGTADLRTFVVPRG